MLRRAPLAGAPNKIRIALGLTGSNQAHLAESCGIQAPNLSDIVNGKSAQITLTTARRISAALGACIEDIFPPACVKRGRAA